MKESRRIQITNVHKRDGYYSMRDEYIGLKGLFKPSFTTMPGGYYSGEFHPDDVGRLKTFFLAIRYKRI